MYRADIDGLRSLAVLSVLFFHVGYDSFSGGFVGVDVFFVISGFLITRIICTEIIKNNSFCFKNFYIRRARRLLPSLFVTFAICFIFAFLLYSPSSLQRFGNSLMSSVFFVSNIFFWNESGYFDTSSIFKPLLHTWSLSVEEQFYILWPIILLLILKIKGSYAMPLLIILIGLISLIANLIIDDNYHEFFSPFINGETVWFADVKSSLFYLTPFRMFEFTIGAITVWAIKFQPSNKLLIESIPIIGLLFILWSIFTYTEKMIFPSIYGLLPCIGSSLIIYSEKPTFARKLLDNQPAVIIGLISYSLYLIHWPIIVFYHSFTYVDFTQAEKALICVISIFIAYLMYIFVEKPFRLKVSSYE